MRRAITPSAEPLEEKQLLSSTPLDALYTSLDTITPSDTPQWSTIDRANHRATDLALSPDGSQIAVMSGSTIELLDAKTGTIQRTLTGHGAEVIQASYSPDGTLVSVSLDGTCKTWNRQTGSVLESFPLPAPGFRIEVAPDGKSAALALYGQSVLLDLQTGAVTQIPGYQSEHSFLPDGKLAMQCGKTLSVYDPATKAKTLLSQVPLDYTTLDSNPNGKYIAVGDYDGYLKLLDAKTGAEVVSLQVFPAGGAQYANQIGYITHSHDGNTLYVSDTRGAIVAYDLKPLATGGAIQKLPNSYDVGSWAYPLIASPKTHTLIANAYGNNATSKIQALAVPAGQWGALPPMGPYVPPPVDYANTLTDDYDSFIRQTAADGLRAQRDGLQADIASVLSRVPLIADDARLGKYASQPAILQQIAGVRRMAAELAVLRDAFTADLAADDALQAALASYQEETVVDQLALNMATDFAVQQAKRAEVAADLQGVQEKTAAITELSDTLLERQELLAQKYQSLFLQAESLMAAETVVDYSDAVSLQGIPTGDAARQSLALALPHIGGDVELLALRGALMAEANLQLTTGAAAARMLGAIDAQGAVLPSLKSAVGLADNQVTWDKRRSVNLPGFGTVTVETDDGIRNWESRNVAPFRYIAEKNGSVVSTIAYTDATGAVKTGEMGQSRVSVFWDNTPRYVSQVTLKQLSPQGSARVYVYDEQGQARMYPTQGSNPVRVDARVTRIDLYPDAGAAYGIESIDTRQVVPNASWQDTADVRRIDGTAALDFADANTSVTRVRGRIASDGANDPVVAHVYRGEREVQTVTVGADGAFDLQDVAGITSIVFTHAIKPARLYLGDVSATSNGNLVETPAPALGNRTNLHYSLASAPEWDRGGYNYIDVGRSKGVLYRYGGQSVTVNGGLFEGIENNDTSKYRRIEVRGMGSGGVSIRGLYYINHLTASQGLQEVPSSFYTIISPQSIVVHPGAPQHLVLLMTGSGPVDMPAFVSSGAEESAVMPPQKPTLDAHFLQWSNQMTSEEGWTTVPFTVRDGRFEVGGPSNFSGLFEIRNSGLQATTMTVEVHVGQTGTSADLLEKTYTGTIGGLQRVALRTNVATHQAGDIITLKVSTADGRSFEYCTHINLPRGGAIRVVDPDTGDLVWCDSYDVPSKDETDRLGRLYFKIGDYTGNEKMKSDALALVNAADWEARKSAYTKLTHLPISAVAEWREVVVGSVERREGVGDIGGNGDSINEAQYKTLMDQVNAMDRTKIFQELIQWCRIPTDVTTGKPVTTLQIGGGKAIRLDTQAGRILAGFYQNAAAVSKSTLLMNAAKIESLLGVSHTGLYDAAIHFRQETYRERVLAEFIKAGYGHVIVSDSQQIQPSAQSVVAQVSVINKSYTSADNFIFVHFDLSIPTGSAPDAFQFSYITASVLDPSPGSSPIALKNVRFNAGQTGLFVAIPISSLPQPEFGKVLEKDYQCQLNVYPTATSTAGLPGNNITVPVHVRLIGGERLSMSNDPRENAVLNQVKNYLIKNMGDGTWHWTIGSELHQNKDYFAMDLNKNSDDYGADLFALGDEGEIIQVGNSDGSSVSLGEVRIKHKTLVPGQAEPVEWIERHYHIPLEKRYTMNGSGQIVEETYVVRRQNGEDANSAKQALKATLQKKNPSVTDVDVQVAYDAINPIVTSFSIRVGQKTDSKTRFAMVGRNLTEGPHDHQSILDKDGNSMNTTLLMASLANEHKMGSITVFDSEVAARVANEKPVTWNPELEWNGTKGMWWSEQMGCALDRSAQVISTNKDGSPIYWVGWTADPTQRSRLIFREIKWKDTNGDTQKKHMWVKQSDSSAVWDAGKRQFYHVQLVP